MLNRRSFAAELDDQLSMPLFAKACALRGLLESRRTRLTPRSRRITAGKLKSLQIGLEAEGMIGFHGIDADILQLGAACSFAIKPMPRPS